MSISMSILILTLDEEINITRCLGSLEWSDDIVVLDSGSNDRTVAIAQACGARTVYRKFDDYSSQRNYGLHEVAYKNEWVLMVDADEVVTAELVTEMQEKIRASNSEVSMYRMRRKDFFMGKWIKRSSGYPTWFGRLVRPNRVRVKRAINEEYHTDGEVGSLVGHLEHFPFNKGFRSWLDKHNRYAFMEAVEKLSENRRAVPLKLLFSINPVERRKAQKSLIYALPGRPALVFVLLYLFRGGFLDGKAGLIFCLLKAGYEFMISCNLYELKRRQLNLPF